MSSLSPHPPVENCEPHPTAAPAKAADPELADIFDISSIQALVSDFSALSSIPIGLVDRTGRVLVGPGWQETCARFHRAHPETCRPCQELQAKLTAGIPRGQCQRYKCPNHLRIVATSIMVSDLHCGNLFIGQFLYVDDPQDEALVAARSRGGGCDEQAYGAAFNAVPRLSRGTLERGMSFFLRLADILSRLSHANLRVGRSLAERDRVLDSLRASEEQFRVMFATSSVGKAQADPRTGRYLRVNAAFCQMTGYSEQALRQRSCFDITHPDDRESDRVHLDALVAGRISEYQTEKRYCRPDGGVVWGQVTVNSTCDGTGKPVHVNAVIQDITARKQAEAEREMTVEFLHFVNQSREVRDLVRAATSFFHRHSECEAVGIRLQDGQDSPYSETLGFSEQFVQAESRACTRDPDEAPVRCSVGDPLLECMCGRVIQGRFDPSLPFFTAAGSFWCNNTSELIVSASEADRQAGIPDRCKGESYISVALIPLRLGTERLGLLQLNDRRPGRFTAEMIALWERLADYLAVALAKFRTDAALRRAKEQWERTFNSVPDLIAILDNHHRIVRVNEAMARRLEIPAQECVGLLCHRVMHNTALPPAFCPHSRTIADGCDHVAEVSEQHLGGDFLVSTTPLLNDQGERIGSVHIAHDITERKRAEEEINRRVEELRLSNEELTRFARASVGRELQMIDLKREMNTLCDNYGEPRRYPLGFEEDM